MPDSTLVMRRNPAPEETSSGWAPTMGAACPFFFSSRKETLVTQGIHSYLDVSSADHLPTAVSAYFARQGSTRASGVVVGLLPFRRDRSPHLLEPISIRRTQGYPLPATTPRRRTTGRYSVAQRPSRDGYRKMVQEALDMMSGSESLRKVVLSRVLELTAEKQIDVGLVLERLALDRNATTFAVALPDDEPGALVGATPELLLEKRGNRFVSVPLAGSARRRGNAVEDKAVAEALLHSEKDRREHASVVESVMEALAPWQHSIHADPTPSLIPTATMWHLGTRIEGEIRDDSVTSLHLAAALHPTAAVCGQPREAAAVAIEQLESFDRGFFTGAIGWNDAAGDGQWMVTIRCAEILGNRARLYAGAGIVTGSDPESEAAETSAKFETLLRALGIDETGRALDEAAA